MRSMLFLPGNTPRMLLNGGALGADGVILDLEDAVAPGEKDAARILVRNALRSMDFGGCAVIVRINALGTPHWRRDIEAVLPAGPNIIMPAKVDGADAIRAISDCMDGVERESGLAPGGVGLIPLIETALGVENACAIAAAGGRVRALYLGAEDLTADLRCRRTREGGEILYARGRLVNAARAAGIDVYDTPFTGIDDEEGLLADARTAKALGFTGKAAISPRQLGAIHAVFTPGADEVDEARRIVRAIRGAGGRGVVALDGKMIDAPVVLRARQVLAAAGAAEEEGETR